MTNVIVKTCLNKKIIKNSNLIQAMKNNVCPKATVIRWPKFSENRICPNIYRMFRSVDWTHDMIIVKWREVTVIQFFRKPNLSEYLPKLSDGRSFPKTEFVRIFIECSECGLNTRHDNRSVKWLLFNFSESRICPNIYRMFRSVDWTHDMIIVKRHLFIWHERKLCALTNAPPLQSTQTGQWLSTLFHVNCSAAQVYVLYPRQFIFVLSCRRRSFFQVLQSTGR